MTTRPIRVDLGEMGRAVEAFEAVRKEFVHLLDVLDGDLKAHLNQWEGDARTAYDTAHREWTDAAADMADQIAFLRHWLTTGHRNYSGALDATLKTWHTA
ncbi:WXG100 family type VII secretion target [Actinomadura rupiterrae]|uniref:WXG100 family type VII secretion target n=1 Tax=Actinomadura rupiterrae TaxID=559627 RepID=UPI0020A2F488|nr:WXG100 family type VII secretion target [Actinomadura rupiterrae]MCP2342541.1 WXG100 family type VII secretion target [Actinomadura rupiterrae]